MQRVLVLAAVVGLAACAAFVQPKDAYKVVAGKDVVSKQKEFLKLFVRVHQPNMYQDQAEVGNNYDIEANINNYKHPRVVKQFLANYKKGFLPRGEPFSIYYVKHYLQAIKLFELFYYANDYETFYKTAVWARDRVNEGMFVYSLNVATLHRPDTVDILIPPLYEIYPFLFVDTEVIEKAYEARQKEVGNKTPQTHLITVNQTVYNQEDVLKYFTEDVGLNAFWTQHHYHYPTWYNTTEYGQKFDRKGELFYYVQKQIYARYVLERLSNDLPEVHGFSYNKPLKTSYNPRLRYHNGEEVPVRPGNVQAGNNDLFHVSDVKAYEKRIQDAIDSGYYFDGKLDKHSMKDWNGIDVLGKMIEGAYDGPFWNYYGSLYHYYHILFGHSADPFHKYGVAPSALEHLETMLRDPAHYQIYKRLQHYFKRYKNNLPHYTHEELDYPGVKVENVEVDKLITYFDNFEIDLDNVVTVGNEEDGQNVDIRAKVVRLNHKPFTYKIHVNSDKNQDVYVRVFLGPKYDYLGKEYELDERRHYFVEMDRFPYKVEAGKNVIERKSQDSSVVAPDQDSYRTFLKKITEAHEGKAEYYLNKAQNHYGYPERLLLPKGKKGGQAFTFYVIVTPYHQVDAKDFQPYDYKAFSYMGVGPNRVYPDDKPLGYPFDRQVHTNEFYTPNQYFKDVLIFHKKGDEVSNVTQ